MLWTTSFFPHSKKETVFKNGPLAQGASFCPYFPPQALLQLLCLVMFMNACLQNVTNAFPGGSWDLDRTHPTSFYICPPSLGPLPIC